jgi:predicted permease
MKHKPWRRWAAIFRRDPRREVDTELDFHIEERVREYIDRGLSPEAARQAATARLGDLTRVRDECADLLTAERRADDRRVRISVSWLDVKLGLRMLRRYPGLSLVAVIGMSVAIAIGAGYFAMFNAALDSSLPMADGDRVVTFRNENPQGLDGEWAFDFMAWRDLKSIGELGAFRHSSYNVITPDGRTEVALVASIMATGLHLTRVPALLGRTLLPEDEQPGAPLVLVIGHDEWQRRFQGAREVLGQTVRLGDRVHTIVGVMPAGFAFPIRHQYWIPLRFDAAAYEPGAGPKLRVFGRLAGGFTIEQARAEVDRSRQRFAKSHPRTHGHLRPHVMPYTQAFFGVDSPQVQMQMRAFQLLVGLLLVIVAVNVSILIYARTATRVGEIAVRSALGASRRRIITQLFVEAFVLSAVAAALGLTLAAIGLRKASEFGSQSTDSIMPYWLTLGLSPAVILYVAALTLLAAAIVGVIPALKATGKRLGALRQFAARGAGLQLGRTWTALIVIQVGIAVAALPHALNHAEKSLRLGIRKPAQAAHGLVRGTLLMNRDGLPAASDAQAEQVFRDRLAARTSALLRRLEREPDVSAVTFAQGFPGENAWYNVELDAATMGAQDSSDLPFEVEQNHVALDLFDVFRVPVIAGRRFVSADTLAQATAVIVDETFAKRIGGGAHVIGRRLRYANVDGESKASPWFEIVGVVRAFSHDFTTGNGFDPVQPRVYHAVPPGRAPSAALIVRMARGNPAAFSRRLEEMAATTDPNLRIEDVEAVVRTWQRGQRAFWALAVGIIAMMASVLLLSAAGIYAMMSFTVARRRREIGIRAALGADARRVLAGIFGRAGAQLGAGVLAGLTITAIIEFVTHGQTLGERGIVVLPCVAAVIVAIGLLAALGPARRGLSVQPTEALREE